MQHFKIRHFPFLLFAFFLLLASPTRAQENNGVAVTIGVGFDNYLKSNHWFPVHIEVANSGPSIEGELRFVSGDPTFEQETIYATPLSLPTQSNKRVTLTVNPANATSEQRVELRDENDRLLFTETINSMIALDSSEILYGVVSPDAGELASLETNAIGGFAAAFVAFLTLDDLPETAVSWQNLDVLILNDVDTSQMSPEQQAALRTWIEAGGQLVVTGGNGWEKTATAVTDLLPVTILGTQSIDDLPNFNQQFQKPIPFRDPGPYLVTTSTLSSGELIFHENGLPILASRQSGRGRVYFLALDPRAAPLLDWDGAFQLWESIVENVPLTPAWAFPIQNGPDAAASASTLPELNLPAVWQLLLFLTIYVLLIGPVNYIVLKRRQQLDQAWITIPVIVVVFSLGTYFVGSQIRGNESIINQISVSFSSAGSEQSQVQTLIGLYAPQRGNYEMILPADVGVRPLTLGGFGGFGSTVSNHTIVQSSDVRIANLRLDVGEVATFAALSSQPGIRVVGEGRLESDNGSIQLTANVLNNSDLTLNTAVLIFGNTAVAIGDLEPGESAQINETISQFVLSGLSGSPSFGSNNSVLVQQSDILLGSSSYYSDPVLYPRWQFLQAMANYNGSNQLNTNVLTLSFWTDEVGVESSLTRPARISSTMLHFVELPLTTNLTISSNMAIPVSFLNWTVLEANNIFSAAPTNLSFSQDASVAFEFTPLAEFQNAAISALSLKVGDEFNQDIVPVVALWDWETELWVEIDNISWGETAVVDFEPYIGLDNTVRIRVVDQSDFGVYIDSLYPILIIGEGS